VCAIEPPAPAQRLGEYVENLILLTGPADRPLRSVQLSLPKSTHLNTPGPKSRDFTRYSGFTEMLAQRALRGRPPASRAHDIFTLL
jgi:hypothetical protein